MGAIRTWLPALAALIAVLAATTPARAAWFKAETDRFVVYGEGREQKVRDYAAKLTTFDRTLRLFHPQTLNRTPATKVVVYLVNDRDDLQRVSPGLNKQIGGFYTAMNEGVFAVALSESGAGVDDVMFHEYAHHFMLENFPAAYPAWFVEGFAEYFMTTEILPDGRVKVGGYNQGRAYSVFMQTWLPMEEVLSKTTAETRTDRMAVYYAQAWLLMHYMRSDPARAAQLNTATQAIAKGEPPVKAFEAATGMSMAELTKALKGYRKLPTLMLTDPQRAAPVITVTALPKSADDCLLDNLRLILTSSGRVDGEFLAAVRKRAAKYPGDGLAETTLARAEFVMGNVAAGEAIMTRRLAAAPQDEETLLLAGTGQLIAGLRDGSQRPARFKAARPLLAKAYNLDKNDFRPLYGYALARSIEPGYPTENDLNTLMEARGLAPAVQEISLRAGLILLRRGDKARAAVVLAPLINNPHAGRAAAQARALLEGAPVRDGDIKGDDDTPPPQKPPQPSPAR